MFLTSVVEADCALLTSEGSYAAVLALDTRLDKSCSKTSALHARAPIHRLTYAMPAASGRKSLR